MNKKSMGMMLKSYRTKRGWNINTCAERSGVSVRYLADIERGDKMPKIETFINILNALSASADDVLQDSLAIGYQVRFFAALEEMETLDPVKQKQAMDICSFVIETFKNG